MTYKRRAEQRRVCPRCGQQVYKTKWQGHERDCVSVTARFGGPARLAQLFRDEPELRVSDLVRQLPGVSSYVMKSMLAAGGVTADEIAERADPWTYAAGRPRCRRCRILLDARGVPPGLADAALCGWCDGTAPEPALPGAAAERPHAHIQATGTGSGRI